MLTNTEGAGVVPKFIRQLFGGIDRIIYSVMAFLFDVFFNVASQDILNGVTVKALVGRLQLIVGIVFIFIFAIHIVQGIVNPDLFADSKNGTSKIVTKIIISLFLISAMIPLNVSGEDHSWNKYMSDQGVLFGTMSYFQYQVLHSNVLGKLILGSDNTATFGDEDANSSNVVTNGITTDNQNVDSENEEISSIGNFTATSIAKMFVFPNMEEGATDMRDKDQIKEHAMCHGKEEFYCDPDDGCDGVGRYQWYDVENEAGQIFGFVDNDCTVTSGKMVAWISGDGIVWQFQYLAPMCTVVGIFVILMLLKFTTDIAIRVFKLVVLRILGPIAAISYSAPGENKMFSSWASSLANAYLEIFLDLSIIYFVILVMLSLLSGELNLGGILSPGTSIGIVTIIFLIIGLLMFAKSAPAYIRQILGLPESNSKGFLGSLLSGIGITAGIAGGAISRAIGNVNASKQRADAAGKDPNLFKQVGAGALGLLTGGVAGGAGALKADSDSKRFSAGLENVRQGNLLNMQRARTQSTWDKRLNDRVATFLHGGESPLELDEREIAKQESIAETAKELVAFQQDRAYKLAGKEKFSDIKYNGKNVKAANLEGFLNARQSAEAAGQSVFKYNGVKFYTRSADTDNFQDELYQKAYDKAREAQEKYYEANGYYNPDDLWEQVVDKQNSYKIAGGSANVDDIKKVRGSGKGATAEAYRIKNSNEYQDHKVNYENRNK